MRTHAWGRPSLAMWLVAFAASLVPSVVAAQPPVVKTVPWVATNPLIPHDTWSGRSIRLKGTTNVQGPQWVYRWDFGDGTSTAEAVVTTANMNALEASHVYVGPVGTIFTATLTVRNTGIPADTASRNYFVEIRPRVLETEVNIAIDEGLWYLHTTMNRTVTCPTVAPDPALPCGTWVSAPGFASDGHRAIDAANTNAFEVNGHLEGGSADNPYTDTVQRGMRRVFTYLTASAVANQNTAVGPVNPDSNGNGIGIGVNQSPEMYQLGIFMDAIVASGTPSQVAVTGPANVISRSYKDIVQDMADRYAYCAYDPVTWGGGWRYSCQDFPDNSGAQWGAIGLMAAEDFGIPIPLWLTQLNSGHWALNSQSAATGVFGYTNPGPIWGPYATTPSGMVQLAMDRIGRGNSRWDNAEKFMRDNFHAETANAGTAVKDYYYGMFAFVKSMLLHDSNAMLPGREPISLLQSSTLGIDPIDWYHAERDVALPNSANNTNGVARTLVNDQNALGYWRAHNFSTAQYPYETAWAIMMLNRTLFSGGAPVAVINANPNPAVAFQNIQLDGGGSFHQDASKSIVLWDWDLDNDGAFDDASGPTANVSFPAVGSYVVRLRVTDNGTPAASDEASLTIEVDTPPIAPTAEAGGPYNFCAIPGVNFFLDGTGSSNPDEGQSEPGQPANTITTYAWDLDNDGQFDDAVGAQPNVTANFPAPGSFLVQLQVFDNTGASFPSSGQGNLSDTDSAQITVRAQTDPACVCATLTARAKPGQVQTNWTAVAGAANFNIYRSTTSGGPYTKIATVPSTQLLYIDTGLTNVTTYHYVVRPAALNGSESCQSNQASATPRTR